MARVLLCYDDSKEAVKALEFAKVVTESGDELVLLWVVPPKDGWSTTSEDTRNALSDAGLRLESITRELRKEEIRAIGMVLEGEVAETIIKTADDLKAKLIVIGYRGVQKVGSFALGSVADHVSRKAGRPVLIVK